VKYPLVVMCTPDGELPAMLRGFARDHRWVLDEVRRSDAVAARLAAPGPAVAFWQLDPTADPPPPLELVAAWRRDLPEAAVVVVSDAKLPPEDRPAWTAQVLDLGARYVLFPPFTRLVLEDLAGGLMAAAVERLTGRPPDPTPPDPEAIDLAETGHADD
jgi:hypothetical protein